MSNKPSSLKLYTPAQIQVAFLAWSTLPKEQFHNEFAWERARQELWHVYCDFRDQKPRGASRVQEASIPIEPALTLVQ